MHSPIRSRYRGMMGAGLLVLVIPWLGGCVEGADLGTKAGGEPPPVTLTMGTNDPQGRTSSDQIEEFARQVEERTAGGVIIEPAYRVGGEDVPGWDQEVAQRVIDGRLDLAVVPARAWDLLDVTSLRALTTPFLISTDEVMDDVVSDNVLAADLMSGLDEVGVTGLALLPEALRHLFLFDAAGLTANGLRGDVRAARSATTWALLEALGARPTDAAIEEGFVGTESSYNLATSFPTSTVVGNLTLFPKINVLAANQDSLAELTDAQRDALREAGLATRDWSRSRAVDDAAMAESYCEGGGSVISAEPAELEALHRRARPVIHDLRRDATTAGLIDRIAALADAAVAPPAVSCAGVPGDNAIEADGGRLPDATYRVEFTDDFLASHGLGTEMVALNHGVWTIRLEGGHWTIDQVAPEFEDHFTGIYQVNDDELIWQFYQGERPARVSWSVDESGDLHFRWLDGPHDAVFHFGLPWVKVG